MKETTGLPGRGQLFGDAAQTLVVRIANIVVAALLGIVVARALGPAGRGIYVLPGVFAGFVVAAFSGLVSAMTYAMLNQRQGRGVIGAALKTLGLFSIAGTLVVAGLALAAHQTWAILPAALILPCSGAVNVVSGYCFGIKNVRASNLLALLTSAVTLVLMASGLFLVGRTPSMAIAMWVGGTFVVAVGSLIVMVLHARHLPADRVPLIPFLRYALKVGLVNVVTLLNYRIDLYIVALFTTPAALGLYGVAVSGAESLQVATQVAAIVTVPHIGALDEGAAARLVARCARNNLALAFAICAVVFLVAPWVVGALYGARFLPAVPALRVLLAGVVALSMGSVISSFFTLNLGKPQISLYVMFVSIAICGAITLWLVPTMGILGAAIGTAVSYTVAQVINTIVFSRRAGLALGHVWILQRQDFTLYTELATEGWRRVRVRLGASS